jgi:hypothetical protein
VFVSSLVTGTASNTATITTMTVVDLDHGGHVDPWRPTLTITLA